MIVVIVSIVLLVVVITIFMFLLRKDKKKVVSPVSKKNEEIKKKVDSQPGNYITPEIFNIGRIPMCKYKSANQCNDKVLYPVNELDPDEGIKMPKDCPCYEFIQPP